MSCASHLRVLGAAALLTAVLLTAWPPVGQAQDGSLSLSGRVVRLTIDGERAVAGERVVLHRVSAREAGPVDSVLTDARGHYAFRVATPDTLAMFLASARYAGIAYFAPPAQAGQDAPPPGEIVVFDTTSRDVPLRVQGRHVVLSAPSPDGVRNVIDVFEIENDTVLTRVAGTANRPTFSTLLPEGAQKVRATQGDVSEDAVNVRDGRADVFAPLAPGVRQMVLTYELPASSFPLSVPLERETSLVEVLLEEPGATASAPGLVAQGEVSVDGKSFRRYLGNALAAGSIVTLSVAAGSGATSGGLPMWLGPVTLILITLGGLWILARRAATAPLAAAARGSTGWTGHAMRPPTTTPLPPVHVQLAGHIAAVDSMLEPGTSLLPAQREELVRYRASLKSQLVRVLASRGGRL